MSYKRGEHSVTCDRCGREYLSSEVRTEWTGDVVCQGCYDPRHQQELLRMRADRIAPNPEFVRKPPTEKTSDRICSSYSALADEAIADCFVADGQIPLPSSTFGSL